MFVDLAFAPLDLYFLALRQCVSRSFVLIYFLYAFVCSYAEGKGKLLFVGIIDLPLGEALLLNRSIR